MDAGKVILFADVVLEIVEFDFPVVVELDELPVAVADGRLRATRWSRGSVGSASRDCGGALRVLAPTRRSRKLRPSACWPGRAGSPARSRRVG